MKSIACTYVFICNIYHVDVTVSFMDPRYNVNEHDGTVQLVLVLTKPSSTEFTLQVTNDDNTAVGK